MSSAEAPWRAAPNPTRVCEWCSTGRAWMRLTGVRKRVRRLAAAGGDGVDLEGVSRRAGGRGG